MNNDFCANCKAWQPPPPGSPGTMGQCRINPPKSFMVMVGALPVSEQERKIIALSGAKPQQASPQPMFISAWPPAPAEGWCSRHVPMDKEKAGP